MKKFFLIILLFLSFGCSKSILITYSYDQSSPGGKLVVIPDKAIEGVNFVMNDRLLVEKKTIKKITVENVPAGDHKISMTCASWYYKDPLNYLDSVKIEPNKEVTKLVPTPPYSAGYYLYLIGTTGLSTLLLILVL